MQAAAVVVEPLKTKAPPPLRGMLACSLSVGAGAECAMAHADSTAPTDAQT